MRIRDGKNSDPRSGTEKIRIHNTGCRGWNACETSVLIDSQNPDPGFMSGHHKDPNPGNKKYKKNSKSKKKIISMIHCQRQGEACNLTKD